MSDDSDAWERTLAEMDALREDLEAEGWNVCAFPAGATGFETQSDRDTDRFGAVFVVPGNAADELARAHGAGSFPRYRLYGHTVGDTRFAVLRFDDPESETCVLVAASYDVADARRLLPDVRETGVAYAHFRKLDGTHLATFELSEPDSLVPSAD